MADLDLVKILEAVLFAADSPVPFDKLADIVSEEERRDVREALKELAERFETEGRPYTLSEVAGGWQIYCRPEYSKWIKELHKGRVPTRLSQAALETLAIIAYKQPIVRAEIEAIRGVDSSGVLATLMRRDLITIAGRAPGMGRALLYRTTREFLRYFGLNFVTDLPRLEEFAEVLGLKPGEMELTVEGAESVAEITGGREASDEEAGRLAEDEEDEPVGPGESRSEESSEDEARSRDAEDETQPESEDRTTDSARAEPDAGEREEGQETKDEACPPRASESVLHDGSHAVGDKRLIDDLDES